MVHKGHSQVEWLGEGVVCPTTMVVIAGRFVCSGQIMTIVTHTHTPHTHTHKHTHAHAHTHTHTHTCTYTGMYACTHTHTHTTY